MPLIDAHAHLDHDAFKDDLDAVLQRAEKAGVKAIITNGVNPASNRAVLKLAAAHPIIKPALGIYPVDSLAKEMEIGEYPGKPAPFDVDEEIEFIRKHKKKIIALGECGLDDHWVKDTLDKQAVVFRKLIMLAIELDKPIIVHSRDAEERTIQELEACGAKKVLMHCFGGGLKLAKRVEKNGWYLSIPPNVVRSMHFQRMVEEININNLLTETDCPYLAPGKDQRNEPAFVAETIKKIAEIKKFDVVETENTIFMNYQRLFL